VAKEPSLGFREQELANEANPPIEKPVHQFRKVKTVTSTNGKARLEATRG